MSERTTTKQPTSEQLRSQEGPSVARTSNEQSLSGYSSSPVFDNFRDVGQGKGGTYTFKDAVPAHASAAEQRQSIQHIGPRGCRSYVGVYFKVDDNRCFCAHINPYLYINEDKHSNREWVVTSEEGERVKQAVLKRLKQEAGEQGWSPQNPDIRKTIVVVCPQTSPREEWLLEPSKIWGTEPGDDRDFLVGHYCIEALKEFLQMPRLVTDVESEGFVVDFKTQRPLMIKYRRVGTEPGVRPPEVMVSDYVEEHGPGDWVFKWPFKPV